MSKTGRGDIVELAAHTIELIIPFGFPHFPPSCKPKSDTYHPDFDPAAICLGDFWSHDKRLPDLIIHIGRMINGEVYSTANGFNEDACAWYNSHPDVFPLAEIDWPSEKTDRDLPGSRVTPTIDILDDSDLATDFDFLSLDESKTKQDPSLENSVAAENPAEAIDHLLLQSLESQRKFFKLRDILKDIDITSGELQRLTTKTDEHIGQATNLHREAIKLENRGEKKKALAAFQQVVFIVSDFPDIEAHIDRLRQTFIPIDVSLSEDVSPETSPAQFFDELTGDDKTSAEPGKIGAFEKKRKPQPSVKRHRLRSLWPSRKQLACIFGGIVAVSIASYGYYYLTETGKMDSAEAAFLRCRTSIENGQFEEAQQGCEQALTAIQEVRLFHRERIVQLRSNIDRTLQSERFVQGLNGRILIDGEYLLKKDAETIETLRSLHQEANGFFLQEDWRQAKDRYEKILVMSKKALPSSDDIVTDSRTKLGMVRFRMAYNTAEHALQNGDWLEAIRESNKAESFLASLPDGERHYANNLMKMKAKGTFESHREQGDAFFAEADWQNAIATYRLALSAIDISALPEQDLEAVRGSMNRAELYRLIDQGNNAFGSGSLDKAIDSYRQAEVFLADPQRLENMDDIEQSRRKLSRVILQARIVRDRHSAERHLEVNDMEAASKVYRQLIEHIKGSQFSNESEFSKINNEISTTVQTLDKQIYIADKAQYLKDKYRTIFIASYPNAIEENLVNPSITFARESGDKMIFKMQCTESGERPLTLILYYAFDKKNGQWELFSEQPPD